MRNEGRGKKEEGRRKKEEEQRLSIIVEWGEIGLVWFTGY